MTKLNPSHSPSLWVQRALVHERVCQRYSRDSGNCNHLYCNHGFNQKGSGQLETKEAFPSHSLLFFCQIFHCWIFYSCCSLILMKFATLMETNPLFQNPKELFLIGLEVQKFMVNPSANLCQWVLIFLSPHARYSD